MLADFWHERWRGGKIGFHQKTIAPALHTYWPKLNLAGGAKVFVPLCGKSLDMLWLYGQRYDVVGVDISEVAIECFCMENALPARRGSVGDFDEYRSTNLRLLCGDFFALKPQSLGTCSAVFDRAALVSWEPALRKKYVEQMIELTPTGCQTLLITAEYSASEITGPPFSVDAECVESLYGRRHDIRELYRKDLLAEEPKWRARGVTQLVEACYHLTRL